MDFGNAEYYHNRELSWLEFNKRVLMEAKDSENPLFERIKFLNITASNLDEFFMIRVASIKSMMDAGYEERDISGMTPKEQFSKVTDAVQDFVRMQYDAYNKTLIPLLKENKVNILSGYEKMNNEQIEYAKKYFMEQVYPVLTPMTVDSSRPFPLIRNKTLNIGALIQKKSDDTQIEFATVQVPSVLPRLVHLPDKKNVTVILLEEIIEMNISKLFLNYNVICAYPYRIMRNSDLAIDDDEGHDLLSEIQKLIKKRQRGAAIKLETEDKIDKRLLDILKKNLEIMDEEIYYINGPLDLTFLNKIYELEGFENLKLAKFIPKKVKELNPDRDIFSQIKEKDVLLHHPYESFEPVIEFVKQASCDPKVLAIKMTLYRVSGNSPIINYLAQAAENGKQVTVLVELKARFDEENNILWAKKLEKSGCHVIYGLVGLKTHSKITLVIRREDNELVRYVHLGTGNYNDATAKLYTDIGLLTADKGIGEDAIAVFNMISGYSDPPAWNKLTIAPVWLRDKFISLIEREIKFAKSGKSAKIIAKMNSLCDKQIIEALYKASCAGVKVQLIVRGICCLIPGIKGVSENITVRSIVGNFLEHSRIYYFANGGMDEVYCSSADWMPRNLDKRVEILFPVERKELKEELLHILQVQLSDNVKSHNKTADGSYVKSEKHGKEKINSQEVFCSEVKKNTVQKQKKEKRRFFIPRFGRN